MILRVFSASESVKRLPEKIFSPCYSLHGLILERGHAAPQP